jgi:hypothetical protein
MSSTMPAARRYDSDAQQAVAKTRIYQLQDAMYGLTGEAWSVRSDAVTAPA